MIYVYGIVPATFPLDSRETGIDGAALRLVPHSSLAALASTVDDETYRPDVVSERAADVEWLRPRAVAHDRVVTWASDRAPIVPFPMWTLFSDDAALLDTLASRANPLQQVLDRVRDAREYTVRVFVDTPRLATAVASMSPTLASLEREIATATPGQAYLLRKKLDAVRKDELRRVRAEVADAMYAELEGEAVDAIRDALAAPDGGTTAVLNASFLVRSDRYDAFRGVLTSFKTRYEPAGFLVEFTGPWPPYHFVR